MARSLETLFSLNGKVIIITGAAGLLGRQHARAVAAFGGTPILLDLHADGVERLANQLNAEYDANAAGFAVDITNEDAVEANGVVVLERHGRIDGLVNNAANNPMVEEAAEKNFSRLENFSVEVWNQDLAVGLTGSFLCAKHYGARIAENSAGGVIVNVSSDLGMIAPDQRLYSTPDTEKQLRNVKPVTYSVVKSGVIGLTRYLATYWNEEGVRCNAICPGGVENGQPEDFLQQISSRIPMGRLAQVDEYQGTLVWMLSDASSYMNGSVVTVDGGRTTW